NPPLRTRVRLTGSHFWRYGARPVASSPVCRGALLGVLLLWPGGARSEGPEAALRASLSAGLDTNPGRAFGASADSLDGVASFLASGEARWAGEAAQAGGAYELGLRKFLVFSSEDFAA